MKKCFKIKEHKRNGAVVKEHIRCVKDTNDDLMTLEEQRQGLTLGQYYELKRNNQLKKPLAEHLEDKFKKAGYSVEIDYSNKSESTYLKVRNEGVSTKIRISGHNNLTNYFSDYNIDSKSSVENALNIFRSQFKNL